MDDLLREGPKDSLTGTEIIDRLWPRKPTAQLRVNDLGWDAYFAYYVDQSKSLKHAVFITHQDLVQAARQLEEFTSKDTIAEEWTKNISDSKLEDNSHILGDSIALVTRLFVMMEIGGDPQLGFSGRPPLHWEEGSLKEFIHHYFNETPEPNHEGVKLEPIFTARNLELVAGIKIEWTSNLADHLRMVGDGEKTVTIFHHASFLRWHQRFVIRDSYTTSYLSFLVRCFLQACYRRP
jgi:hypothetical protein